MLQKTIVFITDFILYKCKKVFCGKDYAVKYNNLSLASMYILKFIKL